MIYDVIVIGLGGHGSAAVAHISSRQHTKVLGIEKYHKNHDNGSSHGKSRIIRQAYFEDSRYVPLLKRSVALWRELAQYHEKIYNHSSISSDDSNRNSNNTNTDNSSVSHHTEYEPIFHEVGSMMIGNRDSSIIVGTLASISQHNLPHTIMTASEVKEKYPAFHLAENEIAVYESEAGYLVPEACIETYLHLATENGAELHFEETFISWENVIVKEDKEDNNSNNDNSLGTSIIEITTSKEKYRCKKLILSVGPWAPQIYGKDIELLLHVERRVLFWIRPKSGLDDFKNIPVYIWDLGERDNFYGFPYQKAGHDLSVKVAIHLNHSASDKNYCTPESIDRTVYREEVDSIINILKDRIPDLTGELQSTTTCMYTVTPDEHFLIDFHPKNSNIILASPCCGHGFKFCSVIGEILADLSVDGFTKHDIEMFRLSESRYTNKQS